MQVDHLVWYEADAQDGQSRFADLMDARPVFGGVHPGEGTCNHLLSLGDRTYVEILGRDRDQDPARIDPEVASLTTPGLYHWAMGGVDLSVLRARALAAGLQGSALVNGGRVLPGGKRLQWQCFGLNGHAFGALVPFFIDWLDSTHPAMTAPRGGTLSQVEVSSNDARALGALYAALGIDIRVTQAETPGLTMTLQSRTGDHVLAMVHPVPRGYVI
ncbi:MAG: VOC family protein [Pseudorhodobacter sp.]|nr:VOC family protein [Pseudorhodobacter sp.]